MRCSSVVFATVLTLPLSSTLGARYFVAPEGNDKSPGTLKRPFRTLRHAADQMEAGDTCTVRNGTYREQVILEKGGEPGKPIRFEAFPGESPVLSGTDLLDVRWSVYKGKIYRTPVKEEFDQLFVDGRMMIEARWPNMRFKESLDRSKWAKATRGSRYGALRDPELAKTGIDWTGALATLNVTHQFYTWTRPAIRHAVGRDVFEYPKNFGKATEMRYGKKSWPWEDDRYYLSGKLAALDFPGEWFLDRQTHTLYLWPEDGANPSSKKVEYKTRDYAFVVEGKDYVQLVGLHFFGATFLFQRSSNHSLVEGCHLLFPTYTRELTELATGKKRAKTARTVLFGDFNTVSHCSLAYSPTSGITMIGRQNTLDDCLIHDVCWSGSLRYVPVAVGPDRKSNAPVGGTVRSNTVFNFGNAGINYRGQPYLIERNHVFNGGLACKDVALIYTGSPYAAGCVVRYNWAHGCRTEDGAGLGIRGDDQTRSLTVHHNVVWDCGRDGIIVKGDLNRIFNNTVLYIGTKGRLGNFIAMPTRPEPVKPWRSQFPLLKVQNTHSQIHNNAARTIAGNQGRRTPFPPGENLGHNYQGEDLSLAGIAEWDFRPAVGSPLIDAGQVIPGATGGFKGKAPDIGAYEFGGEFWKPGHHNGLWVSPLLKMSAKNQYRVSVSLRMPVRQTVSLAVSTEEIGSRIISGKQLAMAPADWMQPRNVVLEVFGRRSLPLVLESPEWGRVQVPDLFALPLPAGFTGWFPQPDLGPRAPLDTRFNTDYFPESRRFQPRASLKPVARAFRVRKPVRVDGRITPGEWPGWTPSRRLVLRPLDENGNRPIAAGNAYVLFDAKHLYVAFKNRPDKFSKGKVSPVRLTGPGAGNWGQRVGLEIDFQAIIGGKAGPVYVLHGFPSGKLDSVTDGGASPGAAAALGRKVVFQAHPQGRSWSAEFSIPFEAIGAGPESLEVLRFNVGHRNGDADDGEWFAWAPTGRANYAVERAGELVFLPPIAASARSLVKNGTFESVELSPWRKANNAGKSYPAQKVERVREGPDGTWCIRMECADSELMKKGVLKWLFPLPPVSKPGTYILSYDLKVQNLELRDKSGLFCSYIRTRTGKKSGRNDGQQASGYSGKELPWTRRDCVIKIPEGATPSFISLQLHKATGTVWLDNVSLSKTTQ